jgi:hypothetical protein
MEQQQEENQQRQQQQQQQQQQQRGVIVGPMWPRTHPVVEAAIARVRAAAVADDDHQEGEGNGVDRTGGARNSNSNSSNNPLRIVRDRCARHGPIDRRSLEYMIDFLDNRLADAAYEVAITELVLTVG